MSKEIINSLKKKFNLPIKVCSICEGDGEIITFCGHDVVEYCRECDGNGYTVNKEPK